MRSPTVPRLPSSASRRSIRALSASARILGSRYAVGDEAPLKRVVAGVGARTELRLEQRVELAAAGVEFVVGQDNPNARESRPGGDQQQGLDTSPSSREVCET